MSADAGKWEGRKNEMADLVKIAIKTDYKQYKCKLLLGNKGEWGWV